MRFERKHALFLIAVAVWNVVIWLRFVVALKDDSGRPLDFYLAHTFLIVVNLAIAVGLGRLGYRALAAIRAERTASRLR